MQQYCKPSNDRSENPSRYDTICRCRPKLNRTASFVFRRRGKELPNRDPRKEEQEEKQKIKIKNYLADTAGLLNQDTIKSGRKQEQNAGYTTPRPKTKCLNNSTERTQRNRREPLISQQTSSTTAKPHRDSSLLSRKSHNS